MVWFESRSQRRAMPAGRLPATLTALVTALMLAACTSEREALIARGFPPAYADGYADGCASGDAAGGGFFSEAKKDANRYGNDSEYTKGWDDGFAKCKRDTEAMVRDARLRQPSRDD